MIRIFLFYCLWALIFSSCTEQKSSVEGKGHSTHLNSSTVSDALVSASADTLANVRADEYQEASLEEAPLIEADDPGNFTQVFAGYLEKKDQSIVLISMLLKAENGVISGKYFYEANPGKVDLLLKGTLEADSLLLVEFDSGNRITGRFHGKFISSETIEGYWSNPDGKNSLPFKLRIDEMEYEQRKIIGLKAEELEEPS